MSIPIITFFNNKGGVGKTSMIYHLSHMFADNGLRVLSADLDPQCNLTSCFLDEDRLEAIFTGGSHLQTILGAVGPLQKGLGDVQRPRVEDINENVKVVLGDMGLSSFEDTLSECWPKCLAGDERSFRVTSAFWRALQLAGEGWADVALIDVGPNLGATNRAALIACDFVVIPLGADLFSLQGLENVGPAFRTWRNDWNDRLGRKPKVEFELPRGQMQPVGYVVLRHALRLDRPVKAFDRWMARIPTTYSKSILGGESSGDLAVENDKNCLAQLRDYRSLMPLAQEARKPMFFLKAADGAMGAHLHAVQQAYDDFFDMAKIIAQRTDLKFK